MWFYSAAAAVILGEFIAEPFFTRPADALANGVALVIGCASASLAGSQISLRIAKAGRFGFVVGGALLILAAGIAIAFKDRPGPGNRIAARATRLVGRVGQARFMFQLLLFAAGYAAFADNAGKVAALYLSWFVISVLAPLELLAGALLGRRKRRLPRQPPGVVERIEDPGIVIARMPRGSRPIVGAKATIGDAGAGIIVDATTLSDEPRVRVAMTTDQPIPALGARVVVDSSSEDQVSGAPDPVVGFVGEGTNLVELHMRMAASSGSRGMAEGRMLKAPIEGRQVLFQVTEAVIAGEPASDGPRDIVAVTARKLGTWEPQRGVFESVAWVPAPGEAVRILAEAQETFVAEEVGHVPGTAYGVRVDLNLAVTHNTAILGVLGVGKTHLALELIQRMLAAEIKVMVLDITGQYSAHLADICSPNAEAAIAAKLNADCAEHLENRRVRGEQAGNIVEFTAAANAMLQSFMDGDERLLVLNPSKLEVSRMDGKPYNGSANSLPRLTVVEITQILAEGLLSQVDDAFTDTARVCVVLEEAHSLVPEWNSTVNAAEGAAVNGIARAILQGRKYGMGCLLITQRTANVTKSILNQCNTVFALRTYDATGMGFLQNYIGASHAQLLAALPERHVVAFGRASSCNAPIIIKLNDAEDVRQGFWAPRLAFIPTTSSPSAAAAELDNQDIPF
jgi:hypothetical protein